MHRRRLTRVLIALLAPAIAVPALVPSATAAGKGPGVPSIDAVAKVYPHLEGGSAYESAVSKVQSIGKNCKPGKAIKGASGRSASYMPADPADYAMTGKKPGIFVSALQFKSAKSAIAYLHASSTSTKKCPVTGPDGEPVEAKITKIPFKLGDERWGFTVEMTIDEQTFISHSLLVRDGKYIVSTGATSMDGEEPSVKKALDLTKVALKAV